MGVGMGMGAAIYSGHPAKTTRGYLGETSCVLRIHHVTYRRGRGQFTCTSTVEIVTMCTSLVVSDLRLCLTHAQSNINDNVASGQTSAIFAR